MKITEILRMALGSLGVNKLRSGLTMLGITIGVFSVIGVMTAVTALRGSIENGLSFLGSNMFQFAKYPINGGGGDEEGPNRRRYEMRRDITLAQAMRYQRLMEGAAEVVCIKTFENNATVQARYQNLKTTPGITFVGSNEHFVTANQYTIDIGRNLSAEDVEFARPVAVIGQAILKRLFPAESPSAS